MNGNINDAEFEYSGWKCDGFLALVILVLVIPGLLAWMIISNTDDLNPAFVLIAVFIGIIDFFCLGGLFVQEPNEARVLTFFGKYKGTVYDQGYVWVNPLMKHRQISLRLGNMNIDPIKVNDKVGNPVLIGMVLVWKINDTYKVVFDIDTNSSIGRSSKYDGLEEFVRIQSDAALREVTSHFPYDRQTSDSDEVSLRDGGDHINDILVRKINDRLAMAGIEVVEARLNYLAYAPEIAAVMLRRQQASAIIMAREKIVEGAVTMVEMALKRMDEGGLVKLDANAKAQMVSSMMVVLCADEPVTPVLNTQG